MKHLRLIETELPFEETRPSTHIKELSGLSIRGQGAARASVPRTHNVFVLSVYTRCFGHASFTHTPIRVCASNVIDASARMIATEGVWPLDHGLVCRPLGPRSRGV